MRKLVFRISTRSDTNRAAQSQKLARGLKFCTKEVEGLYYPYSEKKGADQLRSYCAADPLQTLLRIYSVISVNLI